jgi:hypothetical protein
MIGGVWTALGFVPFDVWLGRAQPASQQFIGLLWLVMGVAFLWAPIRFLVVGRSMASLIPGQKHESTGRASITGIGLRAVTWGLSCGVAGSAISVGLLMLGYEEHSG